LPPRFSALRFRCLLSFRSFFLRLVPLFAVYSSFRFCFRNPFHFYRGYPGAYSWLLLSCTLAQLSDFRLVSLFSPLIPFLDFAFFFFPFPTPLSRFFSRDSRAYGPSFFFTILCFHPFLRCDQFLDFDFFCLVDTDFFFSFLSVRSTLLIVRGPSLFFFVAGFSHAGFCCRGVVSIPSCDAFFPVPLFDYPFSILSTFFTAPIGVLYPFLRPPQPSSSFLFHFDPKLSPLSLPSWSVFLLMCFFCNFFSFSVLDFIPCLPAKSVIGFSPVFRFPLSVSRCTFFLGCPFFDPF